MTPSQALGFETIRVASQFIGLREISPNKEWDNPGTKGRDKELSDKLKAMMRPSPWEDGWSYCAAFVEGCVIQALKNLGYSAKQIKRYSDVMTPHCVTSANNFRERGILTQSPEIGATWLAQHGTSSQGHAGIHTALQRINQSTIEANTSLDFTTPAQDREGDWITTRLAASRGRGDLRTLGWVNPSDILKLIGA